MIENRRASLKNAANKFQFLAIILAFLLSSCAVSKSLSVGDNRYLDLWCLQILNDDEVLAAYMDGNTDDAVKIITCGERYSRFQSIKGNFTCVGFWRYETVEGVFKIIPVFVRTSEYEHYKNK